MERVHGLRTPEEAARTAEITVKPACALILPPEISRRPEDLRLHNGLCDRRSRPQRYGGELQEANHLIVEIGWRAWTSWPQAGLHSTTAFSRMRLTIRGRLRHRRPVIAGDASRAGSRAQRASAQNDYIHLVFLPNGSCLGDHPFDCQSCYSKWHVVSVMTKVHRSSAGHNRTL